MSNGSDKSSIPGANIDVLFGILADQHRRVMLHQLEKEQPVAVEELAKEMVPYIDADPSQITVTLHQQHLPKLDESEILDYDSQSGTICYHGHSFLDEVLDHTELEDLCKK